jgi:hypothetical protein
MSTRELLDLSAALRRRFQEVAEELRSPPNTSLPTSSKCSESGDEANE